MLPLPQVVDNVPEKISMTILHMPLLYKVYIGITAGQTLDFITDP